MATALFYSTRMSHIIVSAPAFAQGVALGVAHANRVIGRVRALSTLLQQVKKPSFAAVCDPDDNVAISVSIGIETVFGTLGGRAVGAARLADRRRRDGERHARRRRRVVVGVAQCLGHRSQRRRRDEARSLESGNACNATSFAGHYRRMSYLTHLCLVACWFSVTAAACGGSGGERTGVASTLRDGGARRVGSQRALARARLRPPLRRLRSAPTRLLLLLL